MHPRKRPHIELGHPTPILPTCAEEALRLLEAEGFEAWCVGGLVRDALRGQAGLDIDIATAAPWELVRDIFAGQGCRVLETGVKQGTVCVFLDGNALEITTYRREGGYSDKRHPDSVVRIEDIAEDLARRDFTINAVAFHPKRGFCDPYGGRRDIERQIIRSVGSPQERFGEDPLRIARACRFASELGFTVEAATERAMRAQKALLGRIACERIHKELNRFFCGSFIREALIKHFEIVSQLIPEAAPMQGFDQRTPYHIYDVLEHTAHCMQACSSHPLIRWAAFFHDIGKPTAFTIDKKGVGHFYGHAKISAELASRVMRRLKMPASFIREVWLLVLHHDDHMAATPKAVKKMLRHLNERVDLFRALCELKRGDGSTHAPAYRGRAELADELESILDAVLANKEPFCLKDLAIDGNDLLARGVPAGPQMGHMLEELLTAVIDEEVANTQSELLAFARNRGASA